MRLAKLAPRSSCRRANRLRLDEAVAELKAAGIDASAIAADCGDTQNALALAGEAINRLGEVDILVNNAGATWGAPAEDHPLEAWDR